MNSLLPLNEDMDAQRWEKEFNGALAAKGIQPIDPGWIISWFANAIMCGYDTAIRRAALASGDEVEHEKKRHLGAMSTANANAYLDRMARESAEKEVEQLKARLKDAEAALREAEYQLVGSVTGDNWAKKHAAAIARSTKA